MDATKACTRCRRTLPLGHFRRSATGYPSRLCAECRQQPRIRGGRRPAVGVGVAEPIVDPTDRMQPRERARERDRMLAAVLVQQMMD